MRSFLLFIAGVVFGALLANSPAASAASNLMFGSFGNATKAVKVTSAGAIYISVP